MRLSVRSDTIVLSRAPQPLPPAWEEQVRAGSASPRPEQMHPRLAPRVEAPRAAKRTSDAARVSTLDDLRTARMSLKMRQCGSRAIVLSS